MIALGQRIAQNISVQCGFIQEAFDHAGSFKEVNIYKRPAAFSIADVAARTLADEVSETRVACHAL